LTGGHDGCIDRYSLSLSPYFKTVRQGGLSVTRTLYLVAYDISNDKRLNQVRTFLKGYSTGGQKSVYECFLTSGELRQVSAEIGTLIETKEDRVHILTMDGRSKTHTLGIAVQPQDPEYFYVG
jgi:CRISPR-associated protein Cas2